MVRTIKLAVNAMFWVLLVCAPAWAQQVNADFDKSVNFAGFKTYAWTQGSVPQGANPLMVQRAQSAIESEVSAIGLVKVDKDPDVLVAFHGATKEDVSLQSWGYSPRFSGGQVDVNRVLVGTLMVDVIDARAKKLAFRATASDTVSDNPQKNEKKIHKAVEKMFEKYRGTRRSRPRTRSVVMDPLRIVAAGEAATGVALILFPRLVVELLFSATVAGAGVATSRLAGMALLALGIACWSESGASGGSARARTALLVYSALATVYLGALAVDGELRGALLWPAVVVHVVVDVGTGQGMGRTGSHAMTLGRRIATGRCPDAPSKKSRTPTSAAPRGGEAGRRSTRLRRRRSRSDGL